MAIKQRRERADRILPNLSEVTKRWEPIKGATTYRGQVTFAPDAAHPPTFHELLTAPPPSRQTPSSREPIQVAITAKSGMRNAKTTVVQVTKPPPALVPSHIEQSGATACLGSTSNVEDDPQSVTHTKAENALKEQTRKEEGAQPQAQTELRAQRSVLTARPSQQMSHPPSRDPHSPTEIIAKGESQDTPHATTPLPELKKRPQLVKAPPAPGTSVVRACST